LDDAGAALPVTAGKQRVLLAALAVRANRIVPVDELVDLVWDGAAPRGAVRALRVYVVRLRHVLGAEVAARIVTRDPGYQLQAGQNELDVLRFDHLCQESGEAARVGAWQRTADLLADALSLWRGVPLVDVPSETLRARELPRLTRLRQQAVERRVDADLHLGRHEQVVAELRDLITRHPLREHLYAQLMLALAGMGDQAEALNVYQHARRTLVDELGVEPGPELRRCQGRVLAGDPALTAPEQPSEAVPRMLPAAVADFTGRDDELKQLSELLTAGESSGVSVVSAIGGTAGVGKTALALHWAHQHADRFPDGQLWVNLRGYDPGRPMSAADALARLLRSLGVPGADIPTDEDERAGRYRSLIAGRRILVVLDNAGEAEQVRPLLPGTATCVVVVTSRDRLAGLVARDGARRVDLGTLPSAEAVGLLRALIGNRVDADLAAAATLANLCCRLPLALRVAAELAASRPAARLADLAGELADQQHRLDRLDAAGDPRTAVRAVFSWSCRHLDAVAARAFRLLGLHPGPDFDPDAAAALTGTTVQQAGHLLDLLARAHLIQPSARDRYAMHDLLHVYARELALAQEGEHERRAALTRLFDHYLYTAAMAMDMTFPAESDRRPHITPPTDPGPAFTSAAVAWNWLDTERPTLAAVVAHTAACGWPDHAIRLSATLFRYLETGGFHLETVAINDHARRAAREAGDRVAEAEALHRLVVVDLRQGRYQQAVDRLEQLLVVYREIGDQAGEAGTLGNLGIAGFLQGRYQQATSHQRQALAAYRATGDQAGMARQFSNLGLIELRLGNYHQASEHFDQALTICRATGNQSTEAYALSNLGVTSLRQGNHQQAREHLHQALRICHDSGNRDCEAYALGNLGVANSRLGNHQLAREHLDQALTICRATGDRSSEAEALNNLGEILLTAGHPDEAQAHQTTALDLASQTYDKYEQARAHHGLARSYHATGDLGQARQHWQRALAIYTDLGTPEAHDVQAQLTLPAG